jgi:hypothetical protein
MRIRLWWLVGLVCTLLVIAMSTRLGHRTPLSTAEAAPPTQESLQVVQRSGAGGQPCRRDRPSQLSQC